MITIIDYGAGNLKSVENAFQFLGKETKITENPRDIQNASLLVLPGVGSFNTGMTGLKQRGLIEPIKTHIKNQRPFLGICLGFQLLFETSSEHGHHDGLGIFKGKIIEFSKQNKKVPHMGWNKLDVVHDPMTLFETFKDSGHCYFVHSFYLDTEGSDHHSTLTTYEETFVSAIQAPHLLATQFHPEKSGVIGLDLLKTFLSKLS